MNMVKIEGFICCVLSLLHQPVPLQRLKRLLCCPNCPYIKWLGWLPLSAEGLADVADSKHSKAPTDFHAECKWDLMATPSN